MSEYIKREDAMEPLCERWKAAESRGDDDIAEIVKMDYITVSNVPSVDVVEVVWCKDCIYNDRGWCGSQEYGTRHVEDNDFCSQGEERRKK